MQDGNEVAVGTGEQARRHFDHRHLAAERRVDRAQLEADVAAANHEQRFRHVRQIEAPTSNPSSAGCRSTGSGSRRVRAGREDAVLERQLGRAVVPATVIDRGPVSVPRPCRYFTLRSRATWPTPLVSLSTTPCLKARSLLTSTFGSLNATPHASAWLRLVDDLGHVQQRLRGDTPAIQAHAARVRFLVDKGDLHAEVGGIERRRIAARPRAEDGDLRRLVCHQPMRTGGRAARSPRRPSAESAWRRRHRSRGGRTRATAAASDAARTSHAPDRLGDAARNAENRNLRPVDDRREVGAANAAKVRDP